MVLESDFLLLIKVGALGIFSLNLLALELAADSLELKIQTSVIVLVLKNTDVCN